MKYLILIASLLVSTQHIHANQTFTHEGPPPQLVELYTSEGCSSCPPADRYISTLINDPGLWSKIIPLAFHVDYWDYIGWKDRFAHPLYKQRQYDYRKSGRLRSVYTPGWVVDGKEWRGFFQGRSLPSATKQSGNKLIVDFDQRNVSVLFESTETTTLTAHVALLGFDQQSQVTAGENHGKTLRHQFVVLDKQQQNASNAQWAFKVPVSEISNKQAIAVWVTPVNDMQILQATAGWIETE